MNKWFNDVFLQSIFDRAGACNSLWLSKKQTAICVENMEKDTVSYSDGVYTYRHLNFHCIWNGRKVTLSYSKKNSCGSIIFGLNEEEQKKHEQERKNEKIRIENERIERTKRNPERLEKQIKALKEQEKNLLSNLSFDDNTEEDVNFYTEKLNECRRLLLLYES